MSHFWRASLIQLAYDALVDLNHEAQDRRNVANPQGLARTHSEARRTDMDRLLTPAQAAEVLGCRRTMIFALISSGDLVSFKLGRLRRVPASAVDAFIATRLADAAMRRSPRSEHEIGAPMAGGQHGGEKRAVRRAGAV
jgi:excisionase family DNA binding protein